MRRGSRGKDGAERVKDAAAQYLEAVLEGNELELSQVHGAQCTTQQQHGAAPTAV